MTTDVAAVQNTPLIDRVWSHERLTGTVRSLILAFAGVALLTLSAKIQVPIHPVPMTLQTLAVLMIGAFYGWKLGAATVLLYLAHGFLGAPVFANTPPLLAGPAYFVGPTAGFLPGFVLSAAIVGFAVERGLTRKPVLLGAAMLLAQAVVFLLGTVWLAQFAQLSSGAVGVGFERAFNTIQPYILGDLVKTALALAMTLAFVKLTTKAAR